MRSKYTAICILDVMIASIAMSQSGLQAPPETIKLVVGTANKDHKIVLSDKGQALEVPLTFPLIGRESVAIEATLTEQGRFDVEQLNAKAGVEVKNVRVEDGLGRAEVMYKAEPMSPEELRKRRDEQLQGLAGMSELLRKKLGEAADANPRRFSAQDRKSWEAMKAGDLYVYYAKVLQTQLAEEHLSRCGLDYDRSSRNAAEKVIPMFIALHSLMTGNTPQDAEEAKAAREAMTGAAGTVLRQALTADLRLRIYSDAATTDANAQWFNAQRVACRAIGASSIRVQGTLDPDKGDRVDWWIIERWDPASITFTTSNEGEVQFDPPQVVDGAARLRVAAGKKAARYWFEMKTDRGDLRIVIHESHIPAESKFPY